MEMQVLAGLVGFLWGLSCCLFFLFFHVGTSLQSLPAPSFPLPLRTTVRLEEISPRWASFNLNYLLKAQSPTKVMFWALGVRASTHDFRGHTVQPIILRVYITR